MAVHFDFGVLCISVDSADTHSLSSEAVHRRAETAALLQQFAVPSSWTLRDPRQPRYLPDRAEITARIPSDVNTRGGLVRLLRQYRAALSLQGRSLMTVAADPYQTKTHWDLLVRHGCFAARPRLSDPTDFRTPQAVRGGLWNLPIHCLFGGGSPKTIRCQAGICRRQIVATAHGRGLFHMIVDVGSARTSWRDECQALEALLRAATAEHRRGALQFLTLGELPRLWGERRRRPPLRSILRPAAA